MTTTAATPNLRQPLSSDEVLRIARLDAERAYRDLTPYRISMALESDGWRVDYDLKNTPSNGGGSHYLMGATGSSTGRFWGYQRSQRRFLVIINNGVIAQRKQVMEHILAFIKTPAGSLLHEPSG